MATTGRRFAVTAVVVGVLVAGCQHTSGSAGSPELTGPASTAGAASASRTASPDAASVSVTSASTSRTVDGSQASARTPASADSLASNPAGTVAESPSDRVGVRPPSADQESFTLSLRTRHVGTLHAHVNAMTVPPGAATVSPPEPSGCPWIYPEQVRRHGTAIPAGCDWSDTSVWIRNASYPASPAAGITYIYGHACRFHICPFSAVRRTGDGGYTVQPGDTAVITTPTESLMYEVCAVGESSWQGGPATQPTCSRTVDLDIVTCGYDGDARTGNIVIAATLVSAHRR